MVTSLSCANRESELSGRSIRMILDASIIRAIVSKFSIWLALLAARSRMRLTIGCMGEKLMTKKTAALYARFSSELQKDRSVDDQFALCEQVAKREGFKIVARYCDRAKSGSKEFGREGFQQLKDAARRREFDVIIVEEHDRLSRDQEGMAGFWKRLKHYGIELWTPKGKQNDLDVGIRSFVSQVFLDDLANKIKRAPGPLVREGLFPGSVTYGYDRLLRQPGVRVINEREAEVVRRIFREYADRISPREIAAGLDARWHPNADGGKNWNHQTFVGGSYARGFIGNRIYIGEIVWNTHRQSKDPETEKTLKRPTPAATTSSRKRRNFVSSIKPYGIARRPFATAARCPSSAPRARSPEPPWSLATTISSPVSFAAAPAMATCELPIHRGMEAGASLARLRTSTAPASTRRRMTLAS